MNMNWLREFCVVVDFRSITKAAEFLYMSQPALSRHISELEADLGAELIVRGNSRVFALTPAGELLFEAGEKLLRDMEKTEVHIKNLGQGSIGSLRVCSKLLCCDEWPRVLYEFRCANPTVDVRFFDLEADFTVSAVFSGQTDLAVAYDYEICQHLDRVNTFRLKFDRFVALVSFFSPLAKLSSVSIEQLMEEQLLIVREPETGILDKGSLDDVMTLFKRNEIPSLTVMSMLLRTQMSDGFAVLPLSLARTYSSCCKILEIEGLNQALELLLIWSRENQNPSVKTFINFIEAEQQGFKNET